MPPVERKVLATIIGLGGSACDFEIVGKSGIALSVVNAARNGLMSKGLVRDSGITKRNPRTGNRNKVWEAVKKDDPGPREPDLL